MNKEIYGHGIIKRDASLYPPRMRQLLNSVGEEPIRHITLFKYPLVETSAIAKAVAGLKSRIPYDDLYHLGMNINGKYNLSKDSVLTFENGSVPSKHGVETMVVNLGNNQVLTINQLLNLTRLRIGNERMTSYSAFRNNCQDFINEILLTGGWSTQETHKFVKQDISGLIKNLPSFTEKIADVITGTSAIIDRQIYGEGGINYAEEKTNPYAYDLMYNFNTNPYSRSEYSLSNFELRN